MGRLPLQWVGSRAGSLLLVFFAVACAGDNRPDGNVDQDIKIEPAGTPPPVTAVLVSPAPAPRLQGYTFPIAGGCLPKGDQLLPNAPRPYRNGFHEGLDLYESDNCTRIRAGTEVVAARPGKVTRADTTYKELTQPELIELERNPASPYSLDRFRGRQVWIDHGDGVVTRYAHLQGIAPGMAINTTVAAGQVIGYVGESGTPESISKPGSENHLHFEVRIADSFVGKDMQQRDVRRAYEKIFAS